MKAANTMRNSDPGLKRTAARASVTSAPVAPHATPASLGPRFRLAYEMTAGLLVLFTLLFGLARLPDKRASVVGGTLALAGVLAGLAAALAVAAR